MTTSSKLVFFGNERLVSGLPHTNAPVLRALLSAGYDIVAVVSHHSDGQSRKSRSLEVAEIAHEHNIPLLLPDKPGDIEAELKSYQADAAVLVAYGRIIPQRIINVFNPTGIINIHPSLLPRHRGPTPIETTLLEGDRHAGVSIMQLTAGMDAGPVYVQGSIELRGNETKQELYDRLSILGTELLITHLPPILNGRHQPTEQQVNDVTYTSMLSKQDGIIDPFTEVAEVIERKVRAYANFPKTKLMINENDVIITSVKVVNENDENRLVISCANNSWLEVVELIVPSGKRMSGEAYLRGYGHSR